MQRTDHTPTASAVMTTMHAQPILATPQPETASTLEQTVTTTMLAQLILAIWFLESAHMQTLSALITMHAQPTLVMQ